MEVPLSANLKRLSFLLVLLSAASAASSENDLYLNFCGTWRHGAGPLSLSVNLSPGCDGVSISANRSALSVKGRITAQCSRLDTFPLGQFSLESDDSHFCVYWEPLLDQFKLQIGGKNLTLCWPASLRDSCCTDLSYGSNTAESKYGIMDGKIRDDLVTSKIHTAYNFQGHFTDCKALCDQASSGSPYGSVLNETVKLLDVEHPCATRVELKTKGDSRGYNVTSRGSDGGEPPVTVYVPPALEDAAKTSDTVVCTFHRNNSLFKDGYEDVQILGDVVEITVGNEVIADLSEPIRIGFHHDVIPRSHSRRCVSWDTRKDPWQVNWLVDGCETRRRGEKHTDCLCNHLTYFTVLVELEPRPVRHLLALTTITYLGCAVSAISSVALIVFFCTKKRRSKEQSVPVHLGLALSLAFLSALFFFTGIMANVGGEGVCVWVGAVLHYALLCSLSWMAIEVFHTFWLVYMVFSPSPRPFVWNLLGFAFPAVPVIILAAVGDIYGLREVEAVDEGPYRMCWMKATPHALLAHHVINGTFLGLLVFSGVVMLLLVYREIRTRDEWKQNGVAFLSMWGLSCLFGTAWGLAFLSFGPLTDAVRFLACFLTAFQGFFLVLRFCMLDWLRKRAGGSALASSSTGSTRQHMLQAADKS